jgi:outer membrane protein TolC
MRRAPANWPLLVLLAAGTLSGVVLAAEDTAASFDAVAQGYVALALDGNLALRGQDLDVERSAAALAAAKARFFPELALNARYTVADGGRQIDFPLGQLLNPAYQTLNQLLVAQGQPPRFTTLPDQSFAFQRPREQDTRITLRQPLYQPAIPAAVTAQRELLGSQQYARLALARQLRRDVIVGYAGYLQALRATEIVAAANLLLDENLRITDSLYANGRVTQDQVLRARAEQLAARQSLRTTEGQVSQARSYVNFLLNRRLDAPLDDAAAGAPGPVLQGQVQQLREDALAQRAELAQLDSLSRAAEAQARAARAALKPQLALGVDAGTQGEQYRLGSGYNFIAASLVLSWKFFDGGANRAVAAQARLAARGVGLQREQAAQRVQLEVQQAVDQLDTARDSLATAQARAEAAQAAFRIASRKRDEGAISQVEFLDARNTLTAAQLNLNVTRFELIGRGAELDHATGSGDLPSPARGISP